MRSRLEASACCAAFTREGKVTDISCSHVRGLMSERPAGQPIPNLIRSAHMVASPISHACRATGMGFSSCLAGEGGSPIAGSGVARLEVCRGQSRDRCVSSPHLKQSVMGWLLFSAPARYVYGWVGWLLVCLLLSLTCTALAYGQR
jgi:hypothetical protein